VKEKVYILAQEEAVQAFEHKLSKQKGPNIVLTKQKITPME